MDADRTAGRRTFPLTVGYKKASIAYFLFAITGSISLITAVTNGSMPPLTLIGLAPMVLALPVGLAAWRFGENTPRLLPYMAINVVISIATPILMAIGIWAG